MGKGGQSAPPPTPPGDTAKADFGAQAAGQGFSMEWGTPDQFSPGGQVTYDKVDLPDRNLGNGQTVEGGQGVTAVHTNFSPEFQGIFDTLTNATQARANAIPTTDWNPNIDTEQFRQSYINQGWADAQPEFNRQDTARNVTMSERGIPIGAEIWNNEQNRVDEQRAAYGQSLSNNATQAAAANEAQQFGQQLTQRQLASAETTQAQSQIQSALAALQGRDAPIVQAAPMQSNVPSITANYDRANAQINAANQQASSAGFGALASLGGGLLGMFSDERLKTDIEKVGKTDDGQNIYTYEYKGDPSHTTHMGLLAQEVEKKHPEAVGEVAGFKTVRYDLATKDKPALSKMLRHGRA